MIKILKNPDTHFFKCSICWCEFSYENEDVTYENVSRLNNYFDFVIHCPYCNSLYNIHYDLREKDRKEISERLNIKYNE